ncbi:MAG: guanylate kinase [Lachnospiraceae bacterium]|nr:guanylate kinase [Lachnospiraceae bacterium]
MGKLFIIMGKSATGKDTIYKRIAEDKELNLKTVVIYTTRPIRKGETDGVEYHFVTVEQMNKMIEDKKVIERRTYPTVVGDWHYFTANDGQIDLEGNNYLMISTLAGYEQIRNYYGSEKVVPIYIEVKDKDRLLRSVEREIRQKKPNFSEVCRRYLADEADFSEEELKRLCINYRYENDNLDICTEKVRKVICENLNG